MGNHDRRGQNGDREEDEEEAEPHCVKDERSERGLHPDRHQAEPGLSEPAAADYCCISLFSLLPHLNLDSNSGFLCLLGVL